MVAARRLVRCVDLLLVSCLLLSFVLPAAPVSAAAPVVGLRSVAAQEGEPGTEPDAEPDVAIGDWEGELAAAGEPVAPLPVEPPLLPALLEVKAERGVLSPGETLALTVSVALAAGAETPVVVQASLLLPEGLATVGGERSLTWSGVQIGAEQPFVQGLAVQLDGPLDEGGEVLAVAATATGEGYSGVTASLLLGAAPGVPALAAEVDAGGAVRAQRH